MNNMLIELNKEINELHLSRYSKENPFGLHKPRGNPSENMIYHLYDDGEVTYQKGGHAYMRRTEFTWREPVSNKVLLQLPKKTYGYTQTYAILTEEEALKYHNKLKEILSASL
jgi:hypothetical protein